MPAPNDLTPEEEREFIEHGLQPLGPGREPLDEGNDGQGQQQGQQQVEETGQQQQVADPTAQQQQQGQEQNTDPEPSNRRPDGTFKPKAEYEAELQAWTARQGQQGQQQGQQQQQPQMVPHQALHAERQRAAEATRQAQLATTRLNAILAAQQQQQRQQGPQMPNPAEDPLGYLQAMEQRIAAFERDRAEEQQLRQIDSALEQDEQLFSSQYPDYDEASDYYVASRARELLAFHTPDRAREIMETEARQIAQQAWQRGQSAAEVVYGLARARGWVAGQQPAWMGAMQQQGQQPQQQQPQQQFQPQQQQRQGPSATQRVQAINNGQQQSRSLSGGGAGQPTTQQLNADALLNMSDEEFEEYLALGTKGANQRFASIG